MCFHAEFGGANPEFQKALIRGYKSEKPLDAGYPYRLQAFFAMFLLTVMAESIGDIPNAWRDNALK
jgi:fructosamine-3-kinase